MRLRREFPSLCLEKCIFSPGCWGPSRFLFGFRKRGVCRPIYTSPLDRGDERSSGGRKFVSRKEKTIWLEGQGAEYQNLVFNTTWWYLPHLARLEHEKVAGEGVDEGTGEWLHRCMAMGEVIRVTQGRGCEPGFFRFCSV